MSEQERINSRFSLWSDSRISLRPCTPEEVLLAAEI